MVGQFDWLAIEGWLYEHEADLLQRKARGLHVLEIGTYAGKSAIAMAHTAASVMCVDNWCGPLDDKGNGNRNIKL